MMSRSLICRLFEIPRNLMWSHFITYMQLAWAHSMVAELSLGFMMRFGAVHFWWGSNLEIIASPSVFSVSASPNIAEMAKVYLKSMDCLVISNHLAKNLFNLKGSLSRVCKKLSNQWQGNHDVFLTTKATLTLCKRRHCKVIFKTIT